MALSGRLDDMNLMEILQVVAFSKKSGTLTVTSEGTRGAVLFHQGRVQCAVSTRTKSILGALARETFDASRVEKLKQRIHSALEELVCLREGEFEFELHDEPPLEWEGLATGNFLLTEGIDPERLLLDLARELDESRRDASRMLEAVEGENGNGSGGDVSKSEGEGAGSGGDVPETTEASFPSSDFTVLVVDDEEQVSRAVSEAIAGTGTTVDTAHSAHEALALVRRLHAAGRPMALVVDVGMPSLDGETFLGGLELAEQVRELDAALPILLMAETLTTPARARARQLGIRGVTFKPTLTKLDPEDYEDDLLTFSQEIVRSVAERVRSRENVDLDPSPPLNLDAIFTFLRKMTEQIHNPGHAVARMILRVASKFAERALILLVKESRAVGLAGVEAGRADRQVSEDIRRLHIPLQDVQPFAEVVYSRSTVRSGHEPGLVPDTIPRGRAKEFALLPLVLNHEVVAIVYIDNPGSGRPLGSSSGLEMFLVQAGMVMDNASLQRKLRATETFSIDNQGPLTQELNRVLPSPK